MIGHRKFTWQTGIPPAAEWFDLERIEEMPDFDPDTQQNTPIFDDDSDDPIDCPVCGAANASFEGRVVKDGRHAGTAYNCNECLTNFWSSSREN